MAEGDGKTDDSPAFRLRPRSGAPKSYYEIRLEYSANPAAFTRERPRNLTRQKAISTKTRIKSATKELSFQENLKRIKEQERQLEEARAKLRRDRASSITSNAQMSPFLERMLVRDLKPSKVYSQNYIVLQIKKVDYIKQETPKSAGLHNQSLTICTCESVDHTIDSLPINPEESIASDPNQKMTLKVMLYDEYSNSLLKVNKILGLGKFKTGPVERGLGNEDQSKPAQSPPSIDSATNNLLPFNVIARYDENCLVGTDKVPLMPFVNITDMIEHPSDPYVEMSPSSP